MAIFPLIQLVRQQPQQPLLYTDGHIFSRYEVLQQVERRAAILHAAGLTPGQHVAILSHTSSSALFWLLACWHQGLVACPLAPHWPTSVRRQLIRQLNLTAGWWPADDPGLPGLPRLVEPIRAAKTASHFEPDNIATLVLTSGSTGTPKAVCHRFLALWANASHCAIPYHQDDRWLLSLPLYHVGGIGIVIRTLLQGAAWVLPVERQHLLTTLQQHPVTHLSLVATQLHRLLEQRAFNQRQIAVRELMLGGGPFSPTLLQQTHQRGFKCWLSYGLSEFAAQVVTAPARNDGGIGIAHSHARLNIVNDELCLRGPAALVGYYDSGQLTTPFDSAGWYHTGDLARLKRGRLYLIGRKDNRFISGGENIQPEVIEQQLLQQPDIRQAIVVPIPDHEYGQRPVLFISASRHYTLSELHALLEPHIPRFMLPDHLLPWPDMSSNKLKASRAQLRLIAEQHLDPASH